MVGPKKSNYYKRKLHFKTPDRILLHLLNYVGTEGDLALPDELTQFGISDAIGLGRTTVSKVIRRLIKKGAIRSARAHVPSGKMRRTVYVLTEEGVILANARRREIEEEVVLFRDGLATERNVRLRDLPNLLPEYATFLQVAGHVSEGAFDLTTFRPTHGKFIDFTERTPRLRYFFGRKRELAEADAWLEDPDCRALVVTGLAGIGKTTLLARKLNDWRASSHLFFQRILPWTTTRSIAHQLAEFLTRMSRRGLARYLEATQTGDLEQIVEILRADLNGVRAVLVYDDYHNAEPTIQNFFRAFLTMMDTIEGPKLVVAGRHVPAFYDRRDVRVRRFVREVSLGGLDPEGAGHLLEARNVRLPPGELDTLLRRTGGHPLFLELADFSGRPVVEDIHRYLNEELFSRITEVEARVLTLASVFRGPVPADALYEEEGVDTATVRGLVEQSLLLEISTKVFDVHDLLRSFLLDTATPKHRKRLHRIASNFYLAASNPNSLEALYHLVEADELTAAARLAVKEGRQILKRETHDMLAILDRVGTRVKDPAQNLELKLLRAQALDTRGELDGAIQVYREVLEMTVGPGLERKIAEAHNRLGDIYRRLGEQASAEEHLEAGLALYRSSKDGAGEAEALHALAIVAEDRGDVARAQRMYDQSRSIARLLGLRELEAELEVATARYLEAAGDRDQSLERKKHALTLAESLGDWNLLARLHVSLGVGYYNMKHHIEAAQEYEQGIQIARRVGNLRILAFGLHNAAGLCLRNMDYQKGEPYLKEAAVLFRKLGDPVREAQVLQYEGLMWSQWGKWGIGKAKLAESVERLRGLSSPADLVRAQYAFSWHMHLHGENDAAVRLVDEAIRTARKIRMDGLVVEMMAYRDRYSQGVVAERTDVPTDGISPR